MSKLWTTEEEATRLAERFNGVNQAEFARKFGLPGGPSMLSQHIKGRRPLNMEAALVYMKGFGVRLEDISPRLARQMNAAMKGLRAVSPAPGETGGHASAGVAHELSHSAFDTPVSIRLEPQMHGVSFPESFLAAVPDGAVSPEFPAGLELQWSTARDPKVGGLVIVRTKHGQVAVRQYRQGKEPGRWIAAATADAFASFDSIEDGLQVLAVATWRPI